VRRLKAGSGPEPSQTLSSAIWEFAATILTASDRFIEIGLGEMVQKLAGRPVYRYDQIELAQAVTLHLFALGFLPLRSGRALCHFDPGLDFAVTLGLEKRGRRIARRQVTRLFEGEHVVL
jgi:hypothetical protein